MNAAVELSRTVGVMATCVALAIVRATFYRRQRPQVARERRPREPNARRYSDAEREAMLVLLNSEEYVDKSPEQVAAILAEQNRYVASPRTMYRVLAERKQVRERRDRRHHPVHAKPVLVAHTPNQVWSWDITKLAGPDKGVWFMLYVVLDIFSRFVVGWLLSERENAEQAQHLLRETMRKYGIEPGQLTVHQDRGPPMRAKSTMQLLDNLGVSRSYNRPRVCNDNPFSESQFGTLKQRPDLQERLGSLQHGRQVLKPLLNWYNYEHHHSGIVMLTPAQVHFGQAAAVLAQRHAVKMAAYDAHPERFINGPPKLERLPTAVWINPPNAEPEAETQRDASSTIEGLSDSREERTRPFLLSATQPEGGCAQGFCVSEASRAKRGDRKSLNAPARRLYGAPMEPLH